MRFVVLLTLVVVGCDDEEAAVEPPPPVVDAGPIAPPPGAACEPQDGPIVAPVWIAGEPGPRDAVGAFGKPDAILLDPNGLLLAGDEDEDYEEVHVYDTRTADGVALPLVDWGADPGPGGDGPLEFRGVSGFAQDRETGTVYVAEQGNARIQVLRPAGPVREAPYYEHEGYIGRRAADPDRPGDGEFVRLQALRSDALGQVFASDDAKRNAASARRDIQVFDREGNFVRAFGAGHLQEPENFVIDEARDRIYVCDEGAEDLVVFRYSTGEFIRRVGGFLGEPNGVDLDQFGYLYTVDQGDSDHSFIRVFEPDGFTEVFHFGDRDSDPTPGRFLSPDTLVVDVAQDVVVLADQGHKRVQAFRLSEVQSRACVRTLRVSGPAKAVAGGTVTLRVEALGPDGELDRTQPRMQATAMGESAPFKLYGGVGSVTVPAAERIDIRLGGLRAEHAVEIIELAAARTVAGPLSGAGLRWQAGEVVHVEADIEVPAGETLHIEEGVVVVLADAARVEVHGDLEALGTELAPIAFTAAPGARWGQIDHHEGSRNAIYRNVFLTHGANAFWERNDEFRHCCAYHVRFRGETLELSRVVVTDSPGKGLLTFDASVLIRGSLFQRLGHGIELVHGTGVVEDSVFVQLRGVDDNDGVYLGAKDAPGRFTLNRVRVADVDDDGIDTENSSPIATDIVVHDAVDKGIALTGGSPVFTNCAVWGARMGVKVDDKFRTAVAVPEFRRCTITANTEYGFLSSNRAGADAAAEIRPHIVDSVVWGQPISLASQFEAGRITVSGSLVDGVPEGEVVEAPVEGTPVFLQLGGRDWRLHPLSPGAGAIGFRGF